MHFGKLLAAGALLTGPIHASLTADNVVQDIQGVADASSALTTTVASLSNDDYSDLAPEIISAFQGIITALANALSDLGLGGAASSSSGSGNSTTPTRLSYSAYLLRRQLPSLPASQPPFTDKADAYYVCQSFREFVRIHQVLLSTVIGQHGLLAQTGFAAPLAAVLRQLESIVDTFAFAIIALAPPCAATSKTNKNSLDQTLQQTVETYPSPPRQ